MSPASYLTAPPRVAATRIPKDERYDAFVPWWTWVSLALFLGVIAVTAVIAIVLSLRTYRFLRETQKRLLVALEDLSRDAEAVERRFEKASERAAELEARLASLQRSAEKLGVLQWAMSDSIDAVNRLRHAVPRK
jgi:hypothetical protein